MRAFAPAKINLTLEVAPPRADGMHPLQSVVMFADVGDWLEARAGDGLSLTISGPFGDQLSEGDANNLVLRAARSLAAVADVPANAALRLEKNLPVASGIGGGSADAAAAIRLLSRLWKIDLPPARLDEIARGLGSDVPVCLAATSAYMSNLGEVWTPIAAPPMAAVLVNPLRELSTPLVYHAFDRMHLGGDFKAAPPPRWPDRATALRDIIATGNTLEAPAAALVPEISTVFAALRGDARVTHAAMSGSGATVFALVDDRTAADAVADGLRAAHPDWWVCPATLGADLTAALLES